MRLSGRPPDTGAAALYGRLFGEGGAGRLHSDIEDWALRNVAPWTLSHAGHDIGVGGFRIGFGETGLEMIFHFLPEVWGQGLASEFVQAALDFGASTLREEAYFALVDPDNTPSIRILEKAGFADAGARDGLRLMRIRP